MRNRILVSLPALLAPLIISCSNQGATRSDSVTQAGTTAAKADRSADEAALRAIYQTMATDMNASNAAGIGALFADDGKEVMSGAPVTTGRDAIQKLMATMFASMKNLKTTMGATSVMVSDAGDMAMVEAPYQMSYTDAKGKKLSDHGTSMTVFRKINGQWKIVYDTNASAVAP